MAYRIADHQKHLWCTAINCFDFRTEVYPMKRNVAGSQTLFLLRNYLCRSPRTNLASSKDGKEGFSSIWIIQSKCMYKRNVTCPSLKRWNHHVKVIEKPSEKLWFWAVSRCLEKAPTFESEKLQKIQLMFAWAWNFRLAFDRRQNGETAFGRLEEQTRRRLNYWQHASVFSLVFSFNCRQYQINSIRFVSFWLVSMIYWFLSGQKNSVLFRAPRKQKPCIVIG